MAPALPLWASGGSCFLGLVERCRTVEGISWPALACSKHCLERAGLEGARVLKPGMLEFSLASDGHLLGLRLLSIKWG
jgi:hypothetical protein